jgi:hypothetical protein
MGKLLKIGQKEFKFKKDAIAYYKAILNTYNFGQSLNDSDYDAVIALLYYDYLNNVGANEDSEQENEEVLAITENDPDESEEDTTIEDIKVARVQFNTKCFEVFYSDNTSQYISYLMLINNNQYNPEKLFYVTCRNSVHADIHAVKREYFDKHSIKGQVKCQETGILSTWTELAVDHRQPNTFSIIVDRFKEVNNFDLEAIEYSTNANNQLVFKNEDLTQRFRNYHKAKANLRIIRKECNSSRTGLARIKKAKKDLTIK